jgi:hypothetical protein
LKLDTRNPHGKGQLLKPIEKGRLRLDTNNPYITSKPQPSGTKLKLDKSVYGPAPSPQKPGKRLTLDPRNPYGKRQPSSSPSAPPQKGLKLDTKNPY